MTGRNESWRLYKSNILEENLETFKQFLTLLGLHREGSGGWKEKRIGFFGEQVDSMKHLLEMIGLRKQSRRL